MTRRKKWIVAVVAAVVVLAAIGAVAVVQRPGHEALAPLKQDVVVRHASFEGGLLATDGYDKLEREDADVKPAVKPYKLKPDLSNVDNLKVFDGLLGADDVRMIAANGFVVRPTDYIQMFHVYENNEYQRPEKIPAFITTDSMLHTYHVFYDYTLRQVESYKLFDTAAKLTEAMLKASEQDLADAKNTDVRDAARRNVGYFAVGRMLLTGAAPPASVKDMARQDVALIMAHADRQVSQVFGHKVDFTQFVPRGHYTRTDRLKRYFRAMMWYGNTQFPIPGGEIGPRPTRQALLVVRNLQTRKAGSDPLMKLWDIIYEPTRFYVGSADDYTVYDYAGLSEKVFGPRPSVDAFGDDQKLDIFIKSVEAMPGPRIDNFVALNPYVRDSPPDPRFPTWRQFRFMGQRFIPDSRVLQEMSHPKVYNRGFPTGLDVFAAMGCERSLEILAGDDYAANEFKGFDAQMAAMRKEMAGTSRDLWQSNLYYGWLWTLHSLVKPVPQGYPTFMQCGAWTDKCLFGALGSWTELRHDTILYAKQSVAQCGGDGEEPPPLPKGYVEPNLEFWSKLKWLNEYTREGLASRGLLTKELEYSFEQLGDWLTFCRRITVKELTNQKVTDEEYAQMCIYGSSLEQMTLSFAGGELMSDTDKDMAVVADVHTSAPKVLEEGTGRAAAIYVVVPIEGKLYLTRGATFTQYEFLQPMDDRLTDEQWQKTLLEGGQPDFAPWTKSFLLSELRKLPAQMEAYDSGC